MTTSSTPDAWLLVAPPSALAALRPLVEAHAARRPVHVVAPERDWQVALDGAAGVMVVGDRRRSPRTGVDGVFVTDAGGRRVPLGWLPRVDDAGLARFAAGAAEVERRIGRAGPVALLGQWDDQVQRTVARSLELLADTDGAERLRAFWWTADRIIRRDLLVALRHGLGLAFYFGHGRAYGWSGYHGLHSRHLEHARGEPAGAILSLTCSTAARRGGKISFAETIVLNGIAAATLGAVRATRTVDNWRWGLALCRELARDPGRRIGDLVVAAGTTAAHEWLAGDTYRIIGDPLARLVGADAAEAACAGVLAPAPDALVA